MTDDYANPNTTRDEVIKSAESGQVAIDYMHLLLPGIRAIFRELSLPEPVVDIRGDDLHISADGQSNLSFAVGIDSTKALGVVRSIYTPIAHP